MQILDKYLKRYFLLLAAFHHLQGADTLRQLVRAENDSDRRIGAIRSLHLSLHAPTLKVSRTAKTVTTQISHYFHSLRYQFGADSNNVTIYRSCPCTLGKREHDAFQPGCETNPRNIVTTHLLN